MTRFGQSAVTRPRGPLGHFVRPFADLAQNGVVIFLCLTFLYPIGLVLLWLRFDLGRTKRLVLSLLSLIVFAGVQKTIWGTGQATDRLTLAAEARVHDAWNESHLPSVAKQVDLTEDLHDWQKPAWLNTTQTVAFHPHLPEMADQLHVTVTGLWCPIPHKDAPAYPGAGEMPLVVFAEGGKYGSLADFVNDTHRSDRLLGLTTFAMNCSGANLSREPSLRVAACRTIRGKTTNLSGGRGSSLFMCASDPVWIDFLIREGKQAVDAGADFFNIDEIQGNGVALWAALGQIGFCGDCLSEWKRYLQESFTEVELRNRFQIASLAKEGFVERFRRTGNLLDYRKRTAADPLVAEFIRFQQRANFRCEKHVIQTIRRYAAERNRPIAITANVAWLDVYEVVGTWVRGLAFADLLDFITFECHYQPDGAKARARQLVFLPRGKWLAFYRLGRAATGTTPLGLLASNQQPSFDKVVGRRDRYHYGLACEAYANRGAYVTWSLGTPSNRKTIGENWKSTTGLFEFVVTHRDLFDGREPYADVGVLYCYNDAMRYKGYTYMGLAQMLAEANIPFEVLFARDGTFMKERLAQKDLGRFKTLVVPSVLDVTDSQKQLLWDFVKSGGTAVICDPRTFELDPQQSRIEDGQGKWVVLPDSSHPVDGYTDLGAHYFQTWDEADWTVFCNAVKSVLGEPWITVNPTDRRILVTPYIRSRDNALVLHAVNYNYVEEEDEFVEQKNVEIILKIPEDFAAPSSATVLSPDFDSAESVDVEVVGGRLRIVIPSLKVYSIVVVQR